MLQYETFNMYAACMHDMQILQQPAAVTFTKVNACFVTYLVQYMLHVLHFAQECICILYLFCFFCEYCLLNAYYYYNFSCRFLHKSTKKSIFVTRDKHHCLHAWYNISICILIQSTYTILYILRPCSQYEEHVHNVYRDTVWGQIFIHQNAQSYMHARSYV